MQVNCMHEKKNLDMVIWNKGDYSPKEDMRSMKKLIAGSLALHPNYSTKQGQVTKKAVI